MVLIRPFRGIRPATAALCAEMACPPHDTLTPCEAVRVGKEKPFSFLHVTRAEINLPEDVDPFSAVVYEKSRDTFARYQADGLLVQDTDECLYIYEQTVGAHTQYGIVACAALAEFESGGIKSHDGTRHGKEEDRMELSRALQANAEPVLLTYRAVPEVDAIVLRVVQGSASLYDVVGDHGSRHRLWCVSQPEDTARLAELFAAKVPCTYNAVGHYRVAGAARLRDEHVKAHPDTQPTNGIHYFMGVFFPDTQLRTVGYHRAVKDLNAMTEEGFLSRLGAHFVVQERSASPYEPSQPHEFSMYLNQRWFKLAAKAGSYDDADPVGRLDVTTLTRHVLEEVLCIHNLMMSQRIGFIRGAGGMEELQRLVDTDEMKVAFALHPVSVGQMLDVADSGKTMPAKTACFEPMLLSGMVVHMF